MIHQCCITHTPRQRQDSQIHTNNIYASLTKYVIQWKTQVVWSNVNNDSIVIRHWLYWRTVRCPAVILKTRAISQGVIMIIPHTLITLQMVKVTLFIQYLNYFKGQCFQGQFVFGGFLNNNNPSCGRKHP